MECSGISMLTLDQAEQQLLQHVWVGKDNRIIQSYLLCDVGNT